MYLLHTFPRPKTENLLTSSAVWCREIALPSKGHSQKYLRFLLLVFLNSSFLVYGLHHCLESDKIRSYKTCFSEVSLLTPSKVKVIIQHILVFNSKINESKNRLVSSHSCYTLCLGSSLGCGAHVEAAALYKALGASSLLVWTAGCIYKEISGLPLAQWPSLV